MVGELQPGVTAVSKDAGYSTPEHAVGDEHQTQDGECPAGRTPGGFEHQKDQNAGRDQIPGVRHAGPLDYAEIVDPDVGHDADGKRHQQPVEPRNFLVAALFAEGIHDEAERQHHRNMQGSMFENDRCADQRGDEVVQRHRDAGQIEQLGQPGRIQLAYTRFLVQVFDQIQLFFRQLAGHRFGNGLIRNLVIRANGFPLNYLVFFLFDIRHANHLFSITRRKRVCSGKVSPRAIKTSSSTISCVARCELSQTSSLKTWPISSMWINPSLT